MLSSSTKSRKKWLLLPLISLIATGCSDNLPTYPVFGKVKFNNGRPVHVGSVELKSREHGIQARGTIAEDGSFTLTTYEDGDGAVAGNHDCVVVQFVMAEEVKGHRSTTYGVVDRRFGSYSTSGLAVEIKPDQRNEVTLVVEGIRGKQSDKHEH